MRMRFLFLLTLGASQALAQSPEVPAPVAGSSAAIQASAADSRLRQLEAIYQQQLRSRHVPLLSKYLTELQLLARTADTPAIQEEIKRVQAIISSGGVVDLMAAMRELNPAAAPGPEPKPVAMPETGQEKRAMITLTPSLAQTILPVPESSASPISAHVGQLTWRIDRLQAGAYDLVLHYASLTPDQQVPVTIELAGQKLALTLDSRQATKDARTFRLWRLGQIILPEDIEGSPLVLTAGTTSEAALIIRNLVLTRARRP